MKRPANGNEWNRLLKREGLGVVRPGDQLRRGKPVQNAKGKGKGKDAPASLRSLG